MIGLAQVVVCFRLLIHASNAISNSDELDDSSITAEALNQFFSVWLRRKHWACKFKQQALDLVSGLLFVIIKEQNLQQSHSEDTQRLDKESLQNKLNRCVNFIWLF